MRLTGYCYKTNDRYSIDMDKDLVVENAQILAKEAKNQLAADHYEEAYNALHDYLLLMELVKEETHE